MPQDTTKSHLKHYPSRETQEWRYGWTAPPISPKPGDKNLSILLVFLSDVKIGTK